MIIKDLFIEVKPEKIKIQYNGVERKRELEKKPKTKTKRKRK
jgi:hypothetical protein